MSALPLILFDYGQVFTGLMPTDPEFSPTYATRVHFHVHTSPVHVRPM